MLKLASHFALAITCPVPGILFVQSTSNPTACGTMVFAHGAHLRESCSGLDSCNDEMSSVRLALGADW